MTPFSAPVGRLARFCEPVASTSSVAAAAARLLDSGLPLLPVASDGLVMGVVDEQSLLRAHLEGLAEDAAISSVAGPLGPTVKPYATGSECLRLMESTGASALIVVDDAGHAIGVLTASRLFDREAEDNRPHVVGGMATPFGVYLTDGNVHGGVSHWALVATGAVMFGLLAAGVVVAKAIELSVPGALAKAVWFQGALNALVLLVFAAGLRLSGLTGIHGAEHKVVNAIEQGEPISTEAVKRMSRIHPRCGTNLAVAATLFLSLASVPWVTDFETRGLVAALVTFFTWRPLGSLAQMYLTTTEPSAANVDKGLKSANDLLEKYRLAPYHQANAVRRIYNSGFAQIVFGSLLVQTLLWLIVTVLHLGSPWRDIIGL